MNAGEHTDQERKVSFEPFWCIEARSHGNEIHTEAPIEVLRAHIEAGRLLVVSGLCDEERALRLRHAVQAWADRRPPFPPGMKASVSGLSFHRYDDERTESRMPHVFHQIGLTSPSHEDNALWNLVSEVFRPFMAMQHQLGGHALALDDPDYRVKVYNHPVGGGFLAKHSHPRELLGATFFLSLSRPGMDHTQGDAAFEIDGVDRPVGAHFAAGNAVFFRYDLPHGVTPIDPGRSRDWSDAAGFWMAGFEPVEAYHRTRRL
jgi:hypothetical protein